MSNTIAIDPKEILFIKENAPTGFPRMIVEALEAEGKKVDRVRVHKEISTIKDGYSIDIIQTARRLLKAIKGVEYSPIKTDQPC